MADGDEIFDLTQADRDDLAAMHRDFVARGGGVAREHPGGAAIELHRGDELIAIITSKTDVEIGYYKVALYQHDPLLFDISTRMTSSKLGVSDRSKLAGDGYGYTWDEITATEHLLSVGQIFECKVRGPYRTAGGGGDGKPIVQLIGNPIGISCEGDS